MCACVCVTHSVHVRICGSVFVDVYLRKCILRKCLLSFASFLSSQVDTGKTLQNNSKQVTDGKIVGFPGARVKYGLKLHFDCKQCNFLSSQSDAEKLQVLGPGLNMHSS